MNRKHLLETLELVRPALSDHNLVPIYQNFIFENKQVYACMDKLTILAPYPEINDVFAVNGKTFIELLRTSTAEDVELTLDKENVLLKNGRSKMKLPYLDKSEFLFEEPEQEKWDIIIDIDKKLIRAFELCLLTAAIDATMGRFLGVTIKGGDSLNMYSCDNDGLSQYKLSSKPHPNVCLQLSNEFAEAVLRIAEKTTCDSGQLYINGDWALAEFGNDYKVYGRILVPDEPFDHEKGIRDNLQGNKPTWVEIPDGLVDCLNRARVVADVESKPTIITVKDNKMELITETHIGVVKDALKIGKHPDVEASVAAKVIHRAAGTCEEFALFENCTVYRREEGFFLIVGNYSEN